MWRPEVNIIWFSQLVSTSWFKDMVVRWTWNEQGSTGLTGQQALPLLLFLCLPLAGIMRTCHHRQNFFCVSWGLNLGPQVCKASTLPTEPSLSPRSLNSFKNINSLNLYSMFHILIPLFPLGTLPSSITITATKNIFCKWREGWPAQNSL